MPYFTVRMELHDPAVGTDYTNLHNEMMKVGFLRKIYSVTESKWFHLPTALYHGESTNMSDARTKAMTAGSAVVKLSKNPFTFELVVMDGIPWTHYGLKPV